VEGNVHRRSHGDEGEVRQDVHLTRDSERQELGDDGRIGAVADAKDVAAGLGAPGGQFVAGGTPQGEIVAQGKLERGNGPESEAELPVHVAGRVVGESEDPGEIRTEIRAQRERGGGQQSQHWKDEFHSRFLSGERSLPKSDCIGLQS